MNVDNLISSVFPRRPLWDQKDAEHLNRYILDKKWDEVAVEMSTTRDAVRAKWKTLRDTFRKELQKKPRPRSGDGGSETSYKPSWKYFESLVFLQDQFTPRRSGGSLPEDSRDSVDIEGANNDVPHSPDFAIDDDDNIQSGEAPSVSISEGVAINRKREKPSDEIGNALIRLEERKLEMLERQNGLTSRIPDDDEAFFNSLLPHVRSLPQAEKLLLRIKMQQLVYDYVTSVAAAEPRDPPLPASSTQQYSNPPSVSSYFSNYSGDEIANNYQNL